MAIPLQYNLRNLFVRQTATLMTAGGIALVVAILVLTLALANGFRQALVVTGSPDNVIVTRTGSQTEVLSGLRREAARIIECDAGRGEPPGRYRLVRPSRRGDQPGAQERRLLQRHGARTANSGLALRPTVQDRGGTCLPSGCREVIVGRALSRRFAGCGLGETLRFGSRDWLVVGIFEAGGQRLRVGDLGRRRIAPPRVRPRRLLLGDDAAGRSGTPSGR